eukprot:TRINITY_DN4165_c0_g1_i1.p1 TRINITY_DN4165_c0_g1~~TRINITY_DN4165_c0_g1_i1.p1  ORF type:complete len:584 (-),score=97.41 TRINITY_DN4165_c0_g1_i1:64-1815(-)
MAITLNNKEIPTEIVEHDGEFQQKDFFDFRSDVWHINEFNSEYFRSLIPSELVCNFLKHVVKKVLLGIKVLEMPLKYLKVIYYPLVFLFQDDKEVLASLLSHTAALCTKDLIFIMSCIVQFFPYGPQKKSTQQLERETNVIFNALMMVVSEFHKKKDPEPNDVFPTYRESLRLHLKDSAVFIMLISEFLGEEQKEQFFTSFIDAFCVLYNQKDLMQLIQKTTSGARYHDEKNIIFPHLQTALRIMLERLDTKELEHMPFHDVVSMWEPCAKYFGVDWLHLKKLEMIPIQNPSTHLKRYTRYFYHDSPEYREAYSTFVGKMFLKFGIENYARKIEEDCWTNLVFMGVSADPETSRVMLNTLLHYVFPSALPKDPTELAKVAACLLSALSHVFVHINKQLFSLEKEEILFPIFSELYMSVLSIGKTFELVYPLRDTGSLACLCDCCQGVSDYLMDSTVLSPLVISKFGKCHPTDTHVVRVVKQFSKTHKWVKVKLNEGACEIRKLNRVSNLKKKLKLITREFADFFKLRKEILDIVPTAAKIPEETMSTVSGIVVQEEMCGMRRGVKRKHGPGSRVPRQTKRQKR